MGSVGHRWQSPLHPAVGVHLQDFGMPSLGVPGAGPEAPIRRPGDDASVVVREGETMNVGAQSIAVRAAAITKDLGPTRGDVSVQVHSHNEGAPVIVGAGLRAGRLCGSRLAR